MNSVKINVNTNYYSTNFKQYPPKAITNTIEQSAKAVQNHFKENCRSWSRFSSYKFGGNFCKTTDR